MKALVYDGKEAAVRDDVEVRPPGPTEVKVRVTVGRAVPQRPERARRHDPVAAARACSGTRARASSTRSARRSPTSRPGDHVVLHTLAFCGACKWCETGRPAYCRKSICEREPAVHRRRRGRVELRGDVVPLRVHGRAGGAVREDRPRDRPLGRLPDRLRRAHRHRLGVEPHRTSASATRASCSASAASAST